MIADDDTDSLRDALDVARHGIARLPESSAKATPAAEVESLSKTLDAWQNDVPSDAARETIRRRLVSLQVVVAKGPRRS
jgi:hypothetical protein